MTNEKRRGFGGGDSAATPPDELPTPEATARRIDSLRRYLREADALCGRVAGLVREGGFDARTRSVMEECAEHFEDMSDVSAGTGLAMRRFLKSV